jgi:hypothetical protein
MREARQPRQGGLHETVSAASPPRGGADRTRGYGATAAAFFCLARRALSALWKA